MPWIIEDKPNPIVCRPALPMDTPEVIKFTRRIWDEEDYVPHVWSEWLQDPEGMLAVAECGGVIVGTGKLTKLSASDWWFEGLRVHPDYEGQGIASHLDNYLFNCWLHSGSGFLRLATSSSREPVIHLSIKKGFHQVGEITTYKAVAGKSAAQDETHPEFSLVSTAEIMEALELLRDPAHGWLPLGLIDLGWQWAVPNEDLIENYVNENQVWWWRNKQGLLIMVPKSDDTLKVARVRMFACQDEDLIALLKDVRFMAGQAGYDQITWLAPLQRSVEKALSSSGFERDWEGSLVIFEKPHPQG
jgi:GNAT superfamily N-acetyltransferase